MTVRGFPFEGHPSLSLSLKNLHVVKIAFEAV